MNNGTAIEQDVVSTPQGANPVASQASGASVDLSTAAVLMRLERRMWTYTRRSKVAERIVEGEFMAEHGAGRYMKRLMKRTDVHRLLDEAYQEHTRLTMPCGFVRGVGVLPIGLLGEYEEKMGGFERAFPGELEKFLGVYHEMVLKQRDSLGDLYDEGEYPSLEVMRGCFALRTVMLPWPAIGGGVVEAFGEGVARQMRAGVEASAREAQRAAVGDLVGRLREVVGRLATSLGEDGKRFHQSTLDALNDLGTVIPKLNIWGDEVLAACCQTIKRELMYLDAKLLREGTGRERASGAAKDVLDRLEGYVW